MNEFVTSDEIRSRFSTAMSVMYQNEVPLYSSLLSLVQEVNQEMFDQEVELRDLTEPAEIERVNVERHGAIRVGTAGELRMLRRLFAVMGMYPVGYYDLSEAGVPVHSTAFRPIAEEALSHNPFRVFTSLLRLELIENASLRVKARDVLAKRDIFTDDALEMIRRYEAVGGLSDQQADQFVQAALETFRWHEDATVDLATYEALAAEHRLVADVVCFRGPHINHLTPRTFDIDEVQRRMLASGMSPKATIEGPPRRRCPILLRQTSFKALDEPTRFVGQQEGTHTARFGEVEQRGVALTPQGRELYDRLLKSSREHWSGRDNVSHQDRLAAAFAGFPDTHEALRKQGLAYYRYQAVGEGQVRAVTKEPGELESLICQGKVKVAPIVYEDFLPVSAAGIFQSNLGENPQARYSGQGSKDAFEDALGCSVLNEFKLYERMQEASKKQALRDVSSL